MGAAVPDALLSLDNIEAPEHLQCPICHKLFKDASLVPCCGTSFCDNCIRDKLIEGGFRCPHCATENVTPDMLGPNKYLREVRSHPHCTTATTRLPVTNLPVPVCAARVWIGLAARALAFARCRRSRALSWRSASRSRATFMRASSR